MAGSEVLFSSKGDGLQPYSKLKELARAVCYIEATSTDPQSNEEYQMLVSFKGNRTFTPRRVRSVYVRAPHVEFDS